MSALSANVTSTYESKNMVFPSSGMQLLSALTEFLGKLFLSRWFHFLNLPGVSIMAHCLSRRLASEDLSSLRGWKDLTWPRICVLLVFLDSWLFLFTCACSYLRFKRDKQDANILLKQVVF